MRFKRYAFFALILLISNALFGQQPASNRLCGYTGKSPWLDWYQQHRDEIAQERGIDTAWLYVPVTVHLVGNDNGTGYYKFEQALRAVCEMNEQFVPARIRFYLMPGDGVRYHNNSGWNTHQFYPGGDEMINENRLPNRLNAFVVADPSGSCGYSWQDAIVIGTNCSGPGNLTWSHEAGHHFSLPHTFSGWEDASWDFSKPAPLEVNGHPVEKIDSSNCSFAGDGFCDTPPDYLSYRWACDENKQSPLVQHDPDGVPFRSDATLFMGYPLDACASRFSPEQIEAMRSNLYTEHLDYLQITDPLAEIDDDVAVELISPIDSQLVQFNNLTLHWNAVPGATYYVVEIGLAPGLSPKFYNQTYYNATSVTITSGIPNNRTLRWRVRAFSEWDVCQPYDNAQTGIFKTKNLSATNELEEVVIAELSPNPVMAGLPALFTITSDEAMDAALNVVDASGRLCQTQQLRLFPGENRLEIPTGSLSAGLYVVTLQNEKGAIVKRLAVAN
jgi:hypothetical protein